MISFSRLVFRRFSVLCLVPVVILFCCSTEPKKWTAVGDSITYLNDHLDETGNRVTKGYLTRVVEKVPDLEYVNKGYNGWTSGGIADKIESLGLESSDWYTVFLGTNDWWQGRPIGTFEDYSNHTGSATVYGAFRIIIDKLRSLNGDARIILLTPLQRGDFVYINDMHNRAYGSYRPKADQTLADVAAAIRDIGEREKLTVVDLYHESGITVSNCVKFKQLRDPDTGGLKDFPYPDYIDVPFDPETDAYPYPTEAIDMTYDALHPSDQGNEIIATMLAAVIKK